MPNNRVQELIKSKVSLAPMAGITDYVLRSIIRKYSKTCLLTSEMISSEFLAQLSRKSDITKRDNNHTPISYQISGHKPLLMQQAAQQLTPIADIIDINMGCPVKKVVGGQDGCSLMRNPKLASDIVKAVKDGIDKPVSVKFRLGYTADEMNYVNFGEQMQKAGAEFITIHARTRSQMYSGNANWKLVRKLKESVDIPVFVNGDIISIDSAIQALDDSNADGVAIGRGILSDPTLIHRIEHFFKTGEKLTEMCLSEKVDIMKLHLEEEIKLRGNHAIKLFRKFYSYYLKGFDGASKLRAELVVQEDYEKILSIINRI